MEYICGVTFYPFARRGSFQEEETCQSLRKMKECTNAEYVILVPNGLQDTPQSEEIYYDCEANVSDEELKGMIAFAKELGLKVILKPAVNCKNGTWRAHISFFDEDVPCEPKWSNWFASYTEFQLHYARIAQETGCVMFIAGCEMVMSEHREAEWRKLIADIRKVYHGPVSYNTDKYQEHNVKWWDCVDVISSSGYYPINDWENQLDRIEKTVRQYNKPFFFAESGCMSTKGSNLVPNNWTIKGEVDAEGQAEWYRAMFDAIEKRDWVKGCVLWSWDGKLYSEAAAKEHLYYEIYQKPAQQVVADYYGRKKEEESS